MRPVIPSIHTCTRTLELGEVDGITLLQRLRGSGGKSSGPTASLVFELDHDGERVAIVCDAPLCTVAIRPAHTLLHIQGADPVRLEPEHGGLELLRRLIAAYQTPLSGRPGLAQAMFAIFAYDAARRFEPKLAQRRGELPDIWAMIPRTCVVVALRSGHAVAIVNAFAAEPDKSVLDDLVGRLRDRSADRTPAIEPPPRSPRSHASTSMDQYVDAFTRAREYIRAGDIFQVVLSLQGVYEIDEPPTTLYRRMAEFNRQTANMLIETPTFALVGASPEILVEKRGRKCIIRPLAGTLAHDGTHDPKLAAQLLTNEKECAEHRMLVDLARNDLGRVCEYGSVLPQHLMKIEWYYNLLHISSEIHGTIRGDRDALDLLVSCFPAGTMTGTPKIRAMEIIDELEPTPRELYSGGLGFITAGGDLLTYITIRSLVMRDGLAFARAGSGIVYDSDVDLEWHECTAKLRNAWRALGPAVQR